MYLLNFLFLENITFIQYTYRATISSFAYMVYPIRPSGKTRGIMVALPVGDGPGVVYIKGCKDTTLMKHISPSIYMISIKI